MRILSNILYIFLTVLLVGYSLYPNAKFPLPPEDSYQSAEEADTETGERRAYFTDLGREEVIGLYKSQFSYLPTLRLNYPPEDAQTLIRDQTRSAYLEELVHPFRESIFINGFIPKEAKDEIWYRGVHFEEKITVRYYSSNPITRTVVLLVSMLLLWFLIKEVLSEKNTLLSLTRETLKWK